MKSRRIAFRRNICGSQLVDDPVYRAKLTRDLRARRVAPPIEQMVWYYGKGKPKDVIELEGRLDVNALNQMSDDELRAELAAIVAKARGTVSWVKPQTGS